MAEFDFKEYARQMRENAVKDSDGVILCSPELWEQIASIVENIPTADVAEVKHGRWIDRYSEKYDNHLYECSECRKKALYDTRGDELGSIKTTQVLSPVCPWCGAKMDE